MKIIHVIGYFQPMLGYEEYYLAKNQIENGHEVFIITSDRYFPFPNYSYIYQKILGNRKSPGIGQRIEYGIPTIRLPVLFEFGVSIILKNIHYFLNKISPDVIHIHGFFNPLTLQVLSKRYDARIIVDEHMIPHYSKSEMGFLFKEIYMRALHLVFYRILLVKRINHVYSLANRVAKYLKIKYDLDSPVIPLGVDTNKFDGKNYNIQKLKRSLGFDNEDFILFSSGKMNKRKGLLDIIRIFNCLGRKYNVGLLIVGSGDINFQKVMKGNTEEKLRHKIKVIPFVPHDDLPAYMSIGNIGIWLGPSISTREFLSIGRPVLAKYFHRKIDSSKIEFIKIHKNVEDSLMWIQRFIEDGSSYETQCQLARRYAASNLDWKISYEKVINLYRY